ncbi:MAG: hypothetical protein LBK43_10840, partial [Treponema sp.]|jgi:hypothetical protein|nr:hypothetical protein [Treponema sp.]
LVPNAKVQERDKEMDGIRVLWLNDIEWGGGGGNGHDVYTPVLRGALSLAGAWVIRQHYSQPPPAGRLDGTRFPGPIRNKRLIFAGPPAQTSLYPFKYMLVYFVKKNFQNNIMIYNDILLMPY